MRLAAALALAAGCADSPPHLCTQLGCAPAGDLDLGDVAAADLEGATLTICRGNTCASGVVEVHGWSGRQITLDGELGAAAELQPDTGGFRVAGEIGQSNQLADGDVFTATLVAADGTPLVSKSWTATYRKDYPNGSDCDPEPCLYATFSPAS